MKIGKNILVQSVICQNSAVTTFYPPKGQVMNIENSYEILSLRRERTFRLCIHSPFPSDPVSTKHKVIKEKTFHEHNGKTYR